MCHRRYTIAVVAILLMSRCVFAGTETQGESVASLLRAVEKNDDLAYAKARERALELPNKEFVALLDSLAKMKTWQAMAIRDGLKLRHDQPIVAKEFDGRLGEIIANPSTTVTGSKRYYTSPVPGISVRGLLRTPEHDTLRFEATLTQKVKAQSQPAVSARERGSLRRRLFELSGVNPANMTRYIAVLRDVPEWTTPVRVASGINGVAKWSPGSVDSEVPSLVEAYRKLRQEADADHMQAARRLILAISSAPSKIAKPALEEIRKFEQDTMPKQDLQPWKDSNQSELFEKDRANKRRLSTARRLLGQAINEKKGKVEIQKLQDAMGAAEKEAVTSARQRAALLLWSQLEKSSTTLKQPHTQQGKIRGTP